MHEHGTKYKLENDHIFPYFRLKAIGYGKKNRLKYALAHELTNRAILTQVANRSKSAATAADYLAEVEQRFPKALSLQCILEDESLWHHEKYEEFLRKRRVLLAIRMAYHKRTNAALVKLAVSEGLTEL